MMSYVGSSAADIQQLLVETVARNKHWSAVMATCGMYNGSGQFAATVGLPAKSGVGGGL